MARLVVLALILIWSPFATGPALARAQEATPRGTPSAASGNFTGLVDIGGRSLWLNCMGEGAPTVILESGSPGMTSADWAGVQSSIAQFTHVCAYDRANVGHSDPAPMPRTVAQMADDLDALLSAAGIPGPYVLASFSFGPWVSRVYASQHPDDIAGFGAHRRRTGGSAGALEGGSPRRPRGAMAPGLLGRQPRGDCPGRERRPGPRRGAIASGAPDRHRPW